MKLPSFSDLSDAGLWVIDQVGDVAEQVLENNVRLGVTGLRRAGKTVFVTSIVDNLLRGARLPFLDAMASGRFQAARLMPQPDADVPRFEIERHLAALTAPEPHWPEPTRGISQLRVAIRYQPGSLIRRRLRPVTTLNLDIVDYPGEWLLDLPLLDQSFAEWSRFTLGLADQPPRTALAEDWRRFVGGLDPAAPADEAAVRQGAALYTEYLHACRRPPHSLSLVQPGRFVEPGDLAGAPLLTFFPLPVPDRHMPRHSLWVLLEERYEAYRRSVVRRFFHDHFARLDRQIVLVDLLGALAAGDRGVADMRAALDASLEAFRHGQGSWLDWITGRRIDRVLFAATKSDHIAAGQHKHLRSLLDSFVAEARNRLRFEGAVVETMALAAVKSTETVTTEHDGRQLACVQGIPVGRDRPTVLYPGDIPDSLADLAAYPERRPNFLEFRPPAGLGRDGRPLPNVRLDQALDYLLGDYLA
ncbi:MAG TPA: YcjX family protein [Azospirillaceae bacterium]|nr:YcjX family protein [Azospirillaceae bacterium]